MVVSGIESLEGLDGDRAGRRPDAARILVVEDEQIVALELKDRLLRAGYDVPAVAVSAEEAIDAAERLRPELVMMDIKLQGDSDGITAAEILRRRVDVPIIYLTAFADADTVERAKGTDPYGYILKPFRERELQVAVEMALYRHGTVRRQRFLADAGREVSASLDRDVLLSRLTELVVRRLSDWCVVHLQEEDDGPLRIHTFAHRASRPGVSMRVVSTALPRGRGTCVARALEGASSRERVADERSWIDGVLGLPPAHVAAADLRASSFVCVPLFTRGRSLGALTLVAEHEAQRFSDLDLLLMEELGRLAGAGVENARLYALAQRAVRVREDVLAIVSHDLKSPLGSISLGVDTLLAPAGLASRENVIERVRRIGRHADGMRRIVEDLLDFARIDSGHLGLNTAPHRLREILDDALALFDDPAAARSVRVLVDDPPEGATALCDRDRALQVLSNLISNAVKLSPAGGAVHIGATVVGGMARFHVSDEAGGIAPDQVQHVFEQYWRAPQPAHPGLGLGLHIAKGIVDAHGGRIWVETTHGAGSTFYFTLPAAPGAGPPS